MVERRYQKREIETMSREQLLGLQWHELQKQVRYTYVHSGLCQSQFRQSGITPDDINTWEDFTRKVPFTTKQDLLNDQKESPPYGTRLAIPEDEIFFTYLTGGTSGKGQEVHTDTEEAMALFSEAIALVYVWAGWKKGDKVMNPLPLGMTQAAPLIYRAMQQVGCDVFNLGTYDTKTKIEYMRRFKLSGIHVSAAYLEALTTEIKEMGLDPIRDFSVRSIVIGGQAYPLSFIHKMEETWHTKIYDNFGATQYALGCTCENGAAVGDRRGYYHLFEHRSVHEVVDPATGQPVGPGEEGELVSTPLNKRASPYLRFRLGDKVRYFPPDACDCGRPFALIEAGTVARYDDMIKIKGVSVWPQSIDGVLLSKDEVAEYKGRVYISDQGKEKVEISVEFKKKVSPERRLHLISQISGELRDTWGIGFAVTETPEKLPRYVTKATSLRWSDERVKRLEKKGLDQG